MTQAYFDDAINLHKFTIYFIKESDMLSNFLIDWNYDIDYCFSVFSQLENFFWILQ